MTDSLIYRMNSEDPIDFDMNKLKAAEDRQIMPNMMTNLGAASLKPITNNQCVPFIRPESPATRFTVFPTQINAPVYISRPSSNHSIRFPDTKPIAISSNIPFKVATIPGVGFSIKVQPKQPVLFSSFPKKLPQNSSNSMHTLN